MRDEKQLLLDNIQEQITENSAFILFNYMGLKAEAASDLRNKVHEQGGYVEMVPKRVLRKAAAAGGVDLSKQELDGHIGLAFAKDDPVGITKSIFAFSKESKALNVLCGQVDGQLYDDKQMKTLSELPSLDQMRSQLLGLFQAPMAQTLSVMNALLCSIPFALENKAKKDSAEA
jgi:large subunit ribosomal protein L10